MSCSDSRQAVPAGPSAVTSSGLRAHPHPSCTRAWRVRPLGPDAGEVSAAQRAARFQASARGEVPRAVGRSTTSTYVDAEGDIVWTTEYLLYRLNLCSHPDAVAKVMRQIDARPLQPLCGSAAQGLIAFPPRNEPVDFRNQLEAKYRDGLRRSPSSTFVDLEGDVVWITEYTRYRVNGCEHDESVQKVFRAHRRRRIRRRAAPSAVAGTRSSSALSSTGRAAPSTRDRTWHSAALNSSSNRGMIVSYQWRCSNTQPANCSASFATPQFIYQKSGPLGDNREPHRHADGARLGR